MVQKNAGAETVSPLRGRPRSFCPDTVMAAVRETFWRRGYDATTMDEIATATGLHKPSLYGAFGDKRAIYVRALNQYIDEMREAFGAAFARPGLFASLEAFADDAIDLYLREGGGGCFMMSTAVPIAGGDEEIGRIVRDAMDALDTALVRRFRKAIEAGELPADADAEALASIVVANHYDLSARARAGYSRTALRALAGRSLKLVRRLAGTA